MSTVNWEIVTDHFCTLGEGPVWDEKRQEIIWLDILEGEIHGYSTKDHIQRTFFVGQPVGAAALRRKGGLIAALQHGFAFINLEENWIEYLNDPEHHLPDNRFNDGKCDPAGRFWAGTMSMKALPAQGNLYCLDKDLSVSHQLGGVGCSNGLAWSPDQKTMYYIDTSTRRIAAFDFFSSSTRGVSNMRTVVEIDPSAGLPDGMSIDTEGMLWVAMWGGGCINRYNPHTGGLLLSIPLPVSHVTSCTFGGEKLQDLYITSAQTGLNKMQLAQEPLAGALFIVEACGFEGLPSFRFKG